MKGMLNIRLAFEKINSHKPIVIIKKTHIILKNTYRCDNRSPYISVYEF
jgi:hypothetical protein